MKKTLKLVALLFALLTLTFSLVACKGGDDGIRKLTGEDKYLLITVGEDAEGNLLSLMQQKAAEGEFAFTEAGGMITSINGIENPADWSYCWMLYTTDSDYANKQYGQIKLGKTVYTSAALGAEALPVKGGEKYLWVYVAF